MSVQTVFIHTVVLNAFLHLNFIMCKPIPTESQMLRETYLSRQIGAKREQRKMRASG